MQVSLARRVLSPGRKIDVVLKKRGMERRWAEETILAKILSNRRVVLQ